MGADVPKAYSGDLRERVIEAVEAGASRREATERFEVSVASAIKWLQRWDDRKRCFQATSLSGRATG
jgi:transposase